MFMVQGERIVLELEDSSLLYFDYIDAWEGFYVLDTAASPTYLIEQGRQYFEYYHNPVGEDLKMYFQAGDDRLAVGQTLVLRLGVIKPDADQPHHSSPCSCTIGGGPVVSASMA